MKQQGSAYHFLGLNAADTNPTARAFLKRYGWRWPSISDPQRTLARRFGANYQPAVLLIALTITCLVVGYAAWVWRIGPAERPPTGDGGLPAGGEA